MFWSNFFLIKSCNYWSLWNKICYLLHYHPSFLCFLHLSVTLTPWYVINVIWASKPEKIFLKIHFGCIRIEMKEMHSSSVLNSSHSQSPCFVLHLHHKCISNWSFNSELHTVTQIETNWSWSISNIFVNRVNI